MMRSAKRTVKQPLVGERARDRGTIRNTMSNELSSERTGANDSDDLGIRRDIDLPM